MSTPLTVQADHVVLFHYVLKGDDGQVIDRSTTDPLAYLHGYSGIIPGLENAIAGKSVNDELEVTIPPAEGYGEIREDAVQSVHRREFPKDMDLQVGMPLRAEGPNGQAMSVWVEKIEGARVHITSNHPLAGKTLHFSVKVAGIREASAEELAHGHVHGPGGHGH